ncbi:amidase [Parazoarcus communis]|uniref:Amidase n=1 Tax=Parazoarcus communis SWub3 = DSM 12120 TaxID=1121029 RepID=A0A323US88_9RHOO|nr:amidase [Parazoarcus communis]NMG71046.1 amidase [Parazoarcus communis SWub3 = DSM 12120]PZA15247.1 amidase [Azoarcus communis] [Parazoarcus communis SWub3 = DSM 12120]
MTTTPQEHTADLDSGFPIHDTVGAWVPHGRFVIPPTAHGPLDGLRFAVKDVFDVAGHPTGAGNPTWLATHPIPERSSPLVDTLLAAGATLVGKVLTDEIAYSINGDNIHYGTPINVRAPGRVPGGSSSGSAAAVAARLCDFALASDTGGSTRVPASYCGLWGLRTTHGVLSRAGMVPLHPFFDTATWLAHDADTFRRVAEVLLPASPHRFRRVLQPMAACALADPEFTNPLNQVLAAASRLLQTEVVALTVTRGNETLNDWRQTYVTAGGYEAWQAHGDWITTHQPTFSPAIAGRWSDSSSITDGAGQAAKAHILEIRSHVRDLFGDDAIAVIPSAASVAPAVDAAGDAVDAVRMRTLQITCMAGIGGLAQVSIPFTGSNGLPLGISLVGPAGSDAELVRLATRIAASL